MELKNNILKLGSYDLDHIFKKEENLEKFKKRSYSNFDFETSLKSIYSKEFIIKVPKNKMPNTITVFGNLDELIDYMYINRGNKNIIPYHGEDISN